MNVFVIIVTYNWMRWAEKSISLLRSSTVPLTIVIVDNCSEDSTRDFVVHSCPDVVWLPQKQNLGFGQGNNIGMQYALGNNADHVLLLNQDAFLQPDAVEQMLKVADGRNIISPIHLNGDGSQIDNNFRESLKRADNMLLDDLLLKGSTNSLYNIGEVCAACWLMPIEILKTVGGFNPLFFQYGEDNNYYTRLQFHGRGMKLAPFARVWHDRHKHGNEKLYNRKKTVIKLLVALCDPGLSFHRKAFRCFDTFIMDPFGALIEMLKLIPMTMRIRQSLSKEKLVGLTWLDDNSSFVKCNTRDNKQI